MNVSCAIEERQVELDAFIQDYFGKDEPMPGLSPVESNVHREEIPDGTLIARIISSNQDQRFSDMYFNGNLGGYPSQSEADLAMCNWLAFWTAKNPEQMDRLFRQSELMRDKWNEKHGAATYGAMTIQKAINGCTEVYKGRQQELGAAIPLQNQGPIDPAKLLEAFEVKKQYVEKLGKEKMLIKNLLSHQHILTVVAMSGGAKTAFFYRYVAPELARQGLTVWYLDADSPPSEHKEMKALADLHGFKFLNADTNEGTSVDGLKKVLRQIADSSSDLTDWVFIFDTLKKFSDLMAKTAVKEFFALCRKLTARGASIVLLAHANKYRSTDGHLIPEGTGDVRSDTDDLIIFERTKNADGGIDVTTVVDPDRNAKVRGLFTPFSFHVSPQREITFYKFPLSVVDPTQTTDKATDDEILDAATGFLKELTEPVMQKVFVSRVCDLTGAGEKRARALIVQNSERKDAEPKKGWRFWYTVGERGRLEYVFPQEEAATCQGELFESETVDHDPTF